MLQPPDIGIPYTLKVSARRRSIGLKIDASGLTVHVPTRMPRGLLEQVLREKSGWIRNKLAAWQDTRPLTDWTPESTLHYLGQPIKLHIVPGPARRAPLFDGATLNLSMPAGADHAMIRRRVVQWYKKEAASDFARRTALLATKLGVPTPPLSLSGARTRWGSCNSRGEIRLNWRLIQAPPSIIHYVVAHELAHLKEMNHSPKFWAWVAQLCADYRTAKIELKAWSQRLHRL